eukprot:9733594-Alexandrium_andersonii.AAC.1
MRAALGTGPVSGGVYRDASKTSVSCVSSVESASPVLLRCAGARLLGRGPQKSSAGGAGTP